MADVSVVPALTDALIAAAREVLDESVVVYDGVWDDEEFGDYLMIGVDDADNPWAKSATGTREWETVGGGQYNDVTEVGDITCAAISWNGDGGDAGQKAARDAVYAIAEALAGVVRTNPTLSIPRLLWVLYGGQWDLLQNKTSGAFARFEFQLHFQALI